ncbi:MAG: beta-ketoacyl synthase N-terminal-like domain-containing protein, partial [Candidatus Omnitrophica bacterium]|nr:beta-ketoacyl synthase N-terminal-like domain-containing protein [Candidatus Omnitrophota bacterium]
MDKRIVISGIGVLASNGVGRAQYWQSLRQGKTGFKEVSLFDVSNLKVKIAGEISDFDAKVFLGQKGL